LIGIHTNLLTPALGDAEALSGSPPTKEEQAALDQLAAFHATGTDSTHGTQLNSWCSRSRP
jgi:hypothetical protein